MRRRGFVLPGDMSVALISTYPPTGCGIGRFARSLVSAWMAAPDTVVRVARVAGADDPVHPFPGVEVQFDPASSVAVRTAAAHVNRSDVALIQHEYGLYGPDEGTAVLDLVDQIRVPVTTVLHTVLPSPNAINAVSLLALRTRAQSWRPPKPLARGCETHARLPNHASTSFRTGRRGGLCRHRQLQAAPSPRHLGPARSGKGIERLLRAMSMIRIEPPVTLDIIGQTHPKVLARSGQSYRNRCSGFAQTWGSHRGDSSTAISRMANFSGWSPRPMLW